MQNKFMPNQFEANLHHIDFSKASPGAIHKILNALHAEIDEALSQKRVPTLEGAFRRLDPSNPVHH